MGFWKLFKEYVKNRLNKNVEPIAKSFGAMCTVWIVSGISALVGIITGEPTAFITALILGLGSTSNFLTVLMRTIFGKVSNGEEEKASSTEETT